MDSIAELLEPHREVLAQHFDAYANHCRRMLRFALSLAPTPSVDDAAKLEIAAAFHDLGLWTANTVDYLPPSVELAQQYLRETGRTEWSDEISAMISLHHKVTPYQGEYPLVEPFRRGDLVDFSWGLVRGGTDKTLVREMKRQYPNCGFHRYLLKRALQWLPRHPLNPAPILKW